MEVPQILLPHIAKSGIFLLYNADVSSFGFRFYFNRRRQWCDVAIHDVSVNTFVRRNGTRWGYYQPLVGRNDRQGKFGEIHIVIGRVTSDLVAHELIHLFFDWIHCRNIDTRRNEERLAWLFDEMTRNFWREYRKVTE